MITAEHKTKRQKNGNVHYYTYYHCTKRKRGPKCVQSVVQQNDLEGQIIATLDQLDISQEVHDFGMKWMREQNTKDSVNTNAVLTNLQKDYKDCVAVVDGLIDMRAREELNKEDFQRRMEDAQKEKKGVAVGEEIEFPLEEHGDFGRIAAQTAKQVILQILREAERASVQSEFSDKEGEIVSGVVQRFDRGNIYIDLGRAIGIMFYNEGIPGEHYRVGERLRFYVAAVQDDPRRPGIVLSRAHPKFIEKLFALEVPEIADHVVEIKQIAREPGSRTKIAVFSREDGIDPVGSAVGQRGTRVMAVTNELGNEKIDVVEWSEDPEKFIANALSPAKVEAVEVLERRTARVLVPEDQLSLAIGRGGQNVRLAARLTGWKIDVRSQSRPDIVQEGGVAADLPAVEISEEKQKGGEAAGAAREE